jgi:hypothetical protein
MFVEERSRKEKPLGSQVVVGNIDGSDEKKDVSMVKPDHS